MGKPMKNRILSIALALSMLAAAFVALPAKGEIDYTGTVRTTDDSGVAKTAFIQGEDVFVYVTMNFHGTPQNVTMDVWLEPADYSTWYSNLHVDGGSGPGNDYTALGVYNSSAEATHLGSSVGLGALDEGVFKVVVTVGGFYGARVAETYITVKAPGIELVPGENTFDMITAYAPGQTLTATVLLTDQQAHNEFYVQVVNDTGVALPGLNWTGQFSSSGYWSKTFTLPADTPDGNDYSLNVRYASNNAPMQSIGFDVRKYVFVVVPHRASYIPGMTALIDYYAVNIGTLGLETGLTIAYSALWLNHSGNNTWLNSTLVGSSGTQSFVIPTDISLYQDIVITYWANETGRSDEAVVTLSLQALRASVSLNDNVFSPGEIVIVTAHVSIGGEALEGATVNVQVSYNGTANATYSASNLMTGPSGSVAYSFTLAASAARGSYIVVATATWTGATAQGEDSFAVDWDGSLSAHFDKPSYYSGETATVNFQAIWNAVQVTLPSITFEFTTPQGVVLSRGNTSTMVATMEIPANYVGTIDLDAAGFYSGRLLQTDASTTVSSATLSLVSTVSGYRPGETLEFSWTLITSASAGNMTYEVSDDLGAIVASGPLEFAKSGSFSYLVPTVNPSGHYHAEVVASFAGQVLTDTLHVHLINDFELQITLKKSSYSDGAFRPGQTIKVQYTIGAYESSQLNAYMIMFGANFDVVSQTIIVTEPTGEFQYTIPKNAPLGQVEFEASLFDVNGGDLNTDAMTMFVINNAESGWDRSIGGMSAIDFVLLVLLIIVIVMLILVPMLRQRMGAPKPPEPAPPAEEGKVPPP